MTRSLLHFSACPVTEASTLTCFREEAETSNRNNPDGATAKACVGGANSPSNGRKS